MRSVNEARIGVIGLGYVGLPLALEFGKRYPTVGFDINAPRIARLRAGTDPSRIVGDDELIRAEQLSYASDEQALADCNVYVVTVPTPLGRNKRPLLTPLHAASTTVGRVLSPGDVVVYESTVFPGCTEEFCVPILERESRLRFNRDFFVGYSPERVNPGDTAHRLPDILKVTSGSTPETAAFLDALYGSIIPAGTHRAPSLKVAEAAKVIENVQRDVNIALVNELALICHRLGIDTSDVLEAAETKWNFLRFRPGLVGGHCIGVDPYYLTHKAEEVGYHPDMILVGRRLNDSMAGYVASQVVKLMLKRNIQPSGSRVLLLGLAFKENCRDARNSGAAIVDSELREFGCLVDVYDPLVDPNDASVEYGIRMIEEPVPGSYDAVVITVAHREFVELGADGIRRFGNPNVVIYDIKRMLPRHKADGGL